MLRFADPEQRQHGIDGHVGGEGEERNATIRSAVFSRVRGRARANCYATAVAETTSMTESSPNPINAAEDTRVPSVSATIASTTLQVGLT